MNLYRPRQQQLIIKRRDTEEGGSFSEESHQMLSEKKIWGEVGKRQQP